MGSKIEWYLVELGRMLKGKVPDEALHELTTESRAHLEASVAGAAKSADPELEAIRLFGTPKALALKYLRERRPFDKGVLLILIVFAVAWYAIPISLFEIAPAGNDFFMAWGVSLCAFFVVSLWFRRFRPLPIIAAVGVAAASVTLVMSYRVYVYDDPYSSGVITISEGKEILAKSSPTPTKLDLKVREGINAFAFVEEVPSRVAEFKSKEGYLVPTFPAKFGGTTPVWTAFPTYESARQQWTSHVRSYVNNLEWSNGRTDHLKQMIAAAPDPGPGNFIPVGKITFLWAGIALGILLGIHGAAACLVSLFEWISIGRRQLA